MQVNFQLIFRSKFTGKIKSILKLAMLRMFREPKWDHTRACDAGQIPPGFEYLPSRGTNIRNTGKKALYVCLFTNLKCYMVDRVRVEVYVLEYLLNLFPSTFLESEQIPCLNLRENGREVPNWHPLEGNRLREPIY